MPTNRAIGNATVALARSILEHEGYEIQIFMDHWVRRQGKWINVGGDLFQVWDILAVLPWNETRHHNVDAIRFVQVTDSSHAAARRAKVADRMTWPPIPTVTYEVWAWRPKGRAFSAWRLDNEMREWYGPFDLRVTE